MSEFYNNYQDMWDSLNHAEKMTLILNLPAYIPAQDGSQLRTKDYINRPWHLLPLELRRKLVELDWTFNLGGKEFPA